MTVPSSHYFIYIEHNSYLIGNQLSSACSDVSIIKAWKRAVRVIELDIWPNSTKDDVHVLHESVLAPHVSIFKGRGCMSIFVSDNGKSNHNLDDEDNDNCDKSLHASEPPLGEMDMSKILFTKGNRAVLARSSQLLVGLMMNMSNANEKLAASLCTHFAGAKHPHRATDVAAIVGKPFSPTFETRIRASPFNHFILTFLWSPYPSMGLA
ncbi:hypothetical protein RHSIM_Rhsim01G0135300 [Rhododendron simsii]|uniref:Phosphoinositide phospholipase C n=1 Tax=Rhododendron simsii TaxID=118357 RepID=A0A834HFB8_RHOSS|nr:hypothetical protein RHSIM_Rhsim01G0135300 [Rhododendron simsii]